MKKLLFLLPIFLIACTSSQEVEFEKSTGTVNQLEAGSRFHINLSESHKVGEGLWAVTENFDQKTVNYLGSAYKADNGGSATFNFKAMEKGKTEINLIKSFARDTIETATFVVEVK